MSKLADELLNLDIKLGDQFSFDDIEDYFDFTFKNKKGNYIYLSPNINNFINKISNISMPKTRNLRYNVKGIKKVDKCVFEKYYSPKLKDGRNFLNFFFKLHNIKILKNEYIQTIDSPFKIPIILENQKNLFFANLQNLLFYDNNSYEILFTYIILPNIISPLLPIIYAHEITHSQICGTTCIEEKFNDELLPIFMEYLYLSKCKDKNIELMHNYCRLKGLLDYINTINFYNDNNYAIDDELITSSEYLVSTIYAYKLFKIYEMGNNNIKMELLSRIQDVFNNNKCVEDLLDQYGLNWAKQKNL